MNLSKTGLNILATVNLIIFFTSWITGISDSGVFFVFAPHFYFILMIFSSLSIYLRRIEIATVLQIAGCFIQGILFLVLNGINMVFTNSNFWESVVNTPFVTRLFFSFIGFCVIATGLLIFEYRKYYPKKPEKIIS